MCHYYNLFAIQKVYFKGYNKLVELKMEDDFKMLCDKFIQHVSKYSQTEKAKLKLEQDAFKAGIISKQNYDKLKLLRENKICTLNILGYSFKKLSLVTFDNEKYVDLIKGVTTYIS